MKTIDDYAEEARRIAAADMEASVAEQAMVRRMQRIADERIALALKAERQPITPPTKTRTVKVRIAVAVSEDDSGRLYWSVDGWPWSREGDPMRAALHYAEQHGRVIARGYAIVDFPIPEPVEVEGVVEEAGK